MTCLAAHFMCRIKVVLFIVLEDCRWVLLVRILWWEMEALVL